MMRTTVPRTPWIQGVIVVGLLCVPETHAPAATAGRPPLVLAASGYLFAGGRIDTSLPGSPMVGQMYVEFLIPETRLHPYPIVMIHGGGQTGTNFTGTPDGREGWAHYFVRCGYAVYVVDQVARGRSPHWSQSPRSLSSPNLARLERRFVAPAQFNLWPQAHLHTQWPGRATPGDPYFDAFYASQAPSLSDAVALQALNRDATVSLLDRIGPAILLVHSQAGAFAWPIADRRPWLVQAIVAVEPNGPPVHDIEFKGGPEWFVDGSRRKPSGLGYVPLTYHPKLALDFVRQAVPDKPTFARCWRQKEPARRLIHLKDVPVLILVAEASYHAAYDHCTAAYLDQAGVRTTLIRLADVGVRGNGHMMMLEKNSDAVAGVIATWLEATHQRAIRSSPR